MSDNDGIDFVKLLCEPKKEMKMFKLINKIRKLKQIEIVICILSMLITGSYFEINSYAAENMIPTYEVKFMLDSEQVLNSDHLLKKTYRNLFETGSNYETVGVLYLETKNRDFGAQGWINRIRIKEGASDFELAYKKRYKVTDHNLDEALSTANTEGFDITDTNYLAEVDWGYSNMTLSLTREKSKTNSDYNDMELPKKDAAIKMIKDEMPGKEKDWLYDGWGKELIEVAKKAGPVYYQKYKGTYDGKKVVVEIWPIENQSTKETTYITEMSFKAVTYEEAQRRRIDLMNYLDGMGILCHKDSLKTQLIIDAYI